MSKFFKVRIKATVIKDLQIEVEDDQDADDAAVIASQCFSLDNDGIPEKYSEDVDGYEEIQESDIDYDQPVFGNESEVN